ncbi:hypothetical protein V492_04439, partial [Pseudogymnoascus sp. VKM F-4246]
ARPDTAHAAVALETLETERGGAGEEIGLGFGGEDAEADVHAGAGRGVGDDLEERGG